MSEYIHHHYDIRKSIKLCFNNKIHFFNARGFGVLGVDNYILPKDLYYIPTQIYCTIVSKHFCDVLHERLDCHRVFLHVLPLLIPNFFLHGISLILKRHLIGLDTFLFDLVYDKILQIKR